MTNFSTGLGIRYADFEFDYAYCHDTDLTYNSQHYFSLAFGVLRDEEEKVVPPIEVTPTATPEVIEIEVIEIEEVVQLTIIEHTIKRGETLSTIANKYYGNPALYKEIAKFNNIKNPNNIKVGTILKIDLSLKDKLKKR
ncbi:MAG: LysM peptidoglycan-binding domain-containing protein [Candidatus Margulisbacteria bacterium]|nr:LysM peptidoglycan-binding domain-containing protein [Candidatus Margulisiibacteriota bacterium]MBU1022617.1 LysM peptidoglycan-binding domain-containing protein [Candidatus Margulisiibacteriota bacterium]MBU1729542.1 LysM peptidoglycan-binding domain-containing protein [Candidatus Margulisiibacteriota bacterium]MBU1955028.1 LysM peptidoglycan-binding domain-containing protein [Candidatus Margulisiibacteriota bacterium]